MSEKKKVWEMIKSSAYETPAHSLACSLMPELRWCVGSSPDSCCHKTRRPATYFPSPLSAEPKRCSAYGGWK